METRAWEDDPKYTIKIAQIARKYKLIAVSGGRHRKVYARKKDGYVYKFPYNDRGAVACIDEVEQFNQDKQGRCARCRLITIDGIPCVVMEYVKNWRWTNISFDDLPDWTWNVDSIQVGFNRRKRIVAYDFGRGNDGGDERLNVLR